MTDTKPAWHDNDDYWRDFGPAIFAPARWEAAALEVDRIIALLDLPELADGVGVLDLPCGPGRHSIEFASRGYAVTGVDRTQRYLDEARSRARTAGLAIEFLQADMRDFARPGFFDVVLNLYTSFGYFEDEGDDVKTARNFHASLKPGGRLVMEMAGKEHLASRFSPSSWRELEDGSLMLEERELVDGWRRIRNRWIIITDGERREHHMTLRFYGSGELARVLQDAGFTKIDIYGALDGRPYDQDAERLVVVATK
jgi:SAM-dependent methyltransferase